MQSNFFSRQNFFFQNTKEKFGGKKIYFANERGPSVKFVVFREILIISKLMTKFLQISINFIIIEFPVIKKLALWAIFSKKNFFSHFLDKISP